MKDSINKLIELYLNDISDYGDDQELLLAEGALNPLKTLLIESKLSPKEILNEAIRKASPKNKIILKDFMLYASEI